MKIGFSSLACPEWDLSTMAQRAKAFGFDGVELRAVQGEMNLTLCSQLTACPENIRQSFADFGVELSCLSSSATFHSNKKREVAQNKAVAREYVELAAKLGCRRVRVFGSEIPPGADRHQVLARIAEALRDLAGFAAKHRVTLVLENSGDFCASDALWYLSDAVQHPAVKAWWNPVRARAANERPTTAMPRQGEGIGRGHVCDGKVDETCTLQSYELPGQGNVGVRRMIQLLRGIGYDDYLVLDWPKMWVPSLLEPDAALPAALAFLREAVDEKQQVLTAYKGVKHAVKLATRPPPPSVHAEAG